MIGTFTYELEQTENGYLVYYKVGIGEITIRGNLTLHNERDCYVERVVKKILEDIKKRLSEEVEKSIEGR